MKLLASLSLVSLVAACGASSPTGGDDDGPGDTPPPPNSGFMAASSYSGFAGTTAIQGGSVSATFSSTPEAYCTEDTIDDCTLVTCPTTPTTMAYVSAGNLAVAGARQPIAMSPQSDASYMAVISQQPLFSGGETLTFTGSGGEVPAFSATIDAPSRASITSPSAPASPAKLAIDRTRDLHVTWSGGGAGKVFVYVFANNTGLGVNCGFDASTGSGSIPASVLGMLPAGDASFSSSSLTRTTTDVGDWRVYAQAFFSNVWPDQSIASALATLQ